VPNHGEQAQIEQLVINRLDPEDSPLTFLSCSNEDSEVEWMKNLEEKAPYCSELDDYSDEKDEVLRDQGDALPYTEGFHLVGQLVASFNPEYVRVFNTLVILTQWTSRCRFPSIPWTRSLAMRLKKQRYLSNCI
jgi:hypothetical protein